MNTAHTLTPAQVGLTTLQNLSIADRLNEWMFDTIRPYTQGRTLEVGSGIGNISALFIRNHLPVFLTDYNPDYCKLLKRRFSGDLCLDGILPMDLADENFEKNYPQLLGSFDTVFALNVVEHIKDDRLALENCYKLLAPGGHVIILVPANPALYNVLDKELEHYRRYTRHSLRQLLSRDFKILKTWYFNLAGIPGWWLSGNVLKRQTLPSGQLHLYNRLVPLFRVLDVLACHQAGLSVVGVGKKAAVTRIFS
jgi:SAM-dependent methyltransferase